MSDYLPTCTCLSAYLLISLPACHFGFLSDCLSCLCFALSVNEMFKERGTPDEVVKNPFSIPCLLTNVSRNSDSCHLKLRLNRKSRGISRLLTQSMNPVTLSCFLYLNVFSITFYRTGSLYNPLTFYTFNNISKKRVCLRFILRAWITLRNLFARFLPYNYNKVAYHLSGLAGPTSQYLKGTYAFAEQVLARMAVLMEQSCSLLPRPKRGNLENCGGKTCTRTLDLYILKTGHAEPGLFDQSFLLSQNL